MRVYQHEQSNNLKSNAKAEDFKLVLSNSADATHTQRRHGRLGIDGLVGSADNN